jgi:hypothetical protein
MSWAVVLRTAAFFHGIRLDKASRPMIVSLLRGAVVASLETLGGAKLLHQEGQGARNSRLKDSTECQASKVDQDAPRYISN